jgi:hypothetical protein
MSLSDLHKSVERLREAAINAAWRQWDAIFTFVKADRPAQGIVDLEALLAFSMWTAEYEPRAWSAAYVWGTIAPQLLSVQRTKNVLKLFPSSLEPRIGDFANTAVARGGDARWRPLMAQGLTESVRPRTESARRQLSSPASLMLRLRLDMGTGVKADALAYLIGLAGGSATVQQITDATRYSVRAVRRGVEELAAGGFVQAKVTAPASYMVDLEAWARLLDLDIDNPPAWRPWAGTYAFVAAVSDWMSSDPPTSPVVAASEARDLMATWGAELDLLNVWLPVTSQYPGEGFLGVFTSKIVGTLTEYLGSVV